MVNTGITQDQLTPAVAMDADRDFVVVWAGYDADDDLNVFARLYDAQGTPQTDEFVVHAETAGLQFEPSVAMADDGHFVVAWREHVDDGAGGFTSDVVARRFDSTGSPMADGAQINTGDVGDHFQPDVAMNADGDFVVAWTREVGDAETGFVQDIFARQFDPTGAAAGDPFEVNPSEQYARFLPAPAMDAGGDFVVAWNGYNAAESFRVFAQHFDADANAQGPELLGELTAGTFQIAPDVAMAEDGRFAVTFVDLTIAGGGQAERTVAVQRYDSAATPAGDLITLSAPGGGGLDEPVAAMDTNGNLVVVYTQIDADTGGKDVTVERFDADGLPRGAALPVGPAEDAEYDQPAVAIDATGHFVTAYRGTAYDATEPDEDNMDVWATVWAPSPPTCADDAISILQNAPPTPVDALANDSSLPDFAQTLQVTELTQPASGTATIVDGGARVSYEPMATFFGIDTFTYTIMDSDGLTDTATVTVTVEKTGPDLTLQFGEISLPIISVPGDRGKATIEVVNAGDEPLSTTVTVDLYASSDAALDGGDVLLASATQAGVKLKAGDRRAFKSNIKIPADLPVGLTYLIASVDPADVFDESDEGNNIVASLATTVVRRFGSFDGRRNVKLTMGTAGGVSGTFSLSGSGYGQVVPGPDGLDVTLYGTDDRSNVKIATGRGQEIALHDVSVVGSLGSLSAPTADLTGDLSLDGGLGKLQLDDVIGPATMTIGSAGNARAGVKLTLDVVDEFSVISGTALGTVTATCWRDRDGMGDAIEATQLTALLIKGDRRRDIAGDFEADLMLGDGGAPSLVLTKATIAGAATDGHWALGGEGGAIAIAGVVEGWSLTGSGGLKSLSLGDVASADVSVDGAAGAIKVDRWQGGSLSAAVVKSIATNARNKAGVPADFGANVTLTGQVGAKQTLGAVKIAGAARDMLWSVIGPVGAVAAAGTIENWQLDVSGDTRSMKLGNVIDADVAVSGSAGAVSAKQWLGGRLTAGEARSLAVTGDKKSAMGGDFNADLILTGASVGQSTLRGAKIAGGASGRWSISGDADSIAILGEVDGWDLTLNSSFKKLQLGDVLSATVSVGGAGGAIRAARWLGGKIQAESLQSLQIVGSGRAGLAGDFGAEVVVSDTQVDQALGKVSVAGAADGATFRCAGNIGSMVLGAMRNSTVLAGVRDGVTWLPKQLEDFARGASIGSLTVRGQTGGAGFSNSVVAARTIGKVSLPQVTTDNAQTDFGIACTQMISYRRAGQSVEPALFSGVGELRDGDYVIRVL